MSWQIPTPDRPKLLKTVKAFFISEGWTAVEPERVDRRIDFVVKNQELTYFVSVVDEAQRNFFRLEKMIEGMVHDVYEINGQKRQTLVYVLNFQSPSAILETLSKREVCAFGFDELSALTGTARYLDGLPAPPDARDMLILAGNPKVCIAISDRFYKSGDRASAIIWARNALARKGGVSVAHARLFEMHLEDGDLESAERVGQEVFYFQPKNVEFLRRMEKLATKKNDLEAAKLYRAKLAQHENVPAPARTFQEIIKRQQAAQTQTSSVPLGSAIQAEPEARKTKVAKLLDKLRGSDRSR